MKTKLFMAAAIAACFGLMTAVTSCEGTDPENTDQTEQGGEQGGPTTDPDDEGGEPVAEVSIYKQWVVSVEPSAEEIAAGYSATTYLYDINVSAENTISIGMMNDMYATMLPDMGVEDFNAETDFMQVDNISISEIKSLSETAGTISGTDGMNQDVTISYENLTANSVTITISGENYPESTYNLSASEKTLRFVTIEM